VFVLGGGACGAGGLGGGCCCYGLSICWGNIGSGFSELVV